jgi:hypothetical protein
MSGQEERCGSMSGQEERCGSMPGQVERIGSMSGQEERCGSMPDQQERSSGMPGQEERPISMSEQENGDTMEGRSSLKRELLLGLTEHCVSDFICNQKGRTGRSNQYYIELLF